MSVTAITGEWSMEQFEYSDDVTVFDDPRLRFEGAFLVISDDDPAIATVRLDRIGMVLANKHHVFLDLIGLDPIVLVGSGTGSEPYMKHKEWAASIHAAMVRHG